MRRFATLIAVLLSLASLAGCSSGGGATPAKQETSSGVRTHRSGPDGPRVGHLWRRGLPAHEDPGAAYLAMEAQGLDAIGAPGEFPNGNTPTNGQGPGMRGDQFAYLVENEFVPVAHEALSTFSIDVDTAAYSKTRTYLLDNGILPPAGAVRIEEFVNYFPYEYAPPEDDEPFAVHVETAAAPWRPEHRLVRVAIKAKEIERQRPPSNLVFLMDVSGSMGYENKLPLAIKGLQTLAAQLGKDDRVAIVVYAGAAGLVLPSVPGDNRTAIRDALERLHAGGSTNGGEGIHLAYQVALDHFIPGGVNRVILCSDGDFNVGTTNPAALVELAARRAKQGIFLTVLGFGSGNHNDAMMEELSNRANGNYAFIDSVREARKVLVEEIDGTLVTVAKDVKIQVEFNPTRVSSYRLIGYENRLLAAADFENDQKDAGEVGAGHSVTAFYELDLIDGDTPGEDSASTATPRMRYQQPRQLARAADSSELLTVRVRYKQPEEATSQLIERPVFDEVVPLPEASTDYQFATAVVAFGMLLRNSEFQGTVSYRTVREMARQALGADRGGYRTEFLELIDAAAQLGG